MVTPQKQKVVRSEKKNKNAIFKEFNNLTMVTPQKQKVGRSEKKNKKMQLS
jgi:hypothetical protein